MTPETRQQIVAVVTAIAWSGFALSWWVKTRKEDEEFKQRYEEINQSMADRAMQDESRQRKLGCKGDVQFGMCMDPPCMDSDGSSALDQSYVRGTVKTYDGLPILPHRIIEDVCINTSDLREGTCKLDQDGGAPVAEWIVVHCDKGCTDGACVR